MRAKGRLAGLRVRRHAIVTRERAAVRYSMRMQKLLLKRLWLLAPGALALALTWLAQANPQLTEELFSRGIYPWLSSAVALLPSFAEFSVAQWVVVAYVLLCAGFLAYYLVRFIRGKGERGMVAWRAVCGALAIASVTYSGFAVLCGLNYYRFTFADVAGFEIRESTPEELVELCEALAAGMNEARAEVSAGVEGDADSSTADPAESPGASSDSGAHAEAGSGSEARGMPVEPSELAQASETPSAAEQITRALEARAAQNAAAAEPDAYAEANGGFSAYAQRAVRAIERLAETYPALERPLYSPPKPVLFSELMSYADIGGMYFPFTVESNINTSGPFFTLPATMAHELAHQCGFMREDEANFIAYLTCKDDADPLVRYSGLTLAFDHASSALARTDYEAYVAVYGSLAYEVRADRSARLEYWARYEGPVAHVSNAANNTYLRANGQTDGTASYGRMVDLLLAEQRAARE